MPRLLALGHVSRDRRPGGDVLGGEGRARDDLQEVQRLRKEADLVLAVNFTNRR